ncbi:hypothetical protein Pfo_004654 [Paulownia fortunei]|nr:hypothetical protein Pfo_004654 [Paulownia fortunei]
MSVATASYLARRAAQKERVRILYRRALKDTLNWAVHRHLFYPDADALREKFEANRQVVDIELIDRMIAAGEATHNKWRHPDPYIGLSIIFFEQFHGLLVAPNFAETQHPILCYLVTSTPYFFLLLQIEIIYDYGREDNG